MLKIAQYPLNADRTPMDLLVGVLTDASGNGGARLASPPVGPDGSPIDAKGLVLVDSSGNPVVISAPTTYATRASLAARPGPVLNEVVNISEGDYAGTFIVRNAAQYTAAIAADTTNGMVLLSGTDATKVYVRLLFANFYVSRWWGVSPSNTAAQNVTCYRAAMATLTALAQSGFGYVVGTAALYTPTGHYLFNDELAPQSAIDSFGDNLDESGGGTVFEWTGSSRHMVYLQGWDGASRHAMGAAWRNMHIRGWYATPSDRNTGKIGIYLNAACHLENLYGENCPSHFIEGFGDSGTTNGNLNGAKIINVYAQLCDTTLYLHGADSNGCIYTNISSGNNRLGTTWDHSFLGCSGRAGRAENGGLDTNFRSRCEKSGHIYVVAYGQEVWCSTNSPSGTTASNTGWLYLMDGSTNFYTATWVTGQTWYWTAPVSIGPPDNGNTQGSIDAVYVEGGQNPVMLAINARCTTTTTVVVWSQAGLLHGGYQRGSLQSMHFNNGIDGPGNISFGGTQHFLGPSSGAGGDLFVNLYCTNFTCSFPAFRYSGATQIPMGGIQWFNGSYYVDGVFGGYLRYNGNIIATILSTGLDLPTGKVFSINGVQVVGGRDTGWTAGTGTANKGAFAAYAGATVSAAYVQAEAQATNDAAKNASQRIKAIEDALRSIGLIN